MTIEEIENLVGQYLDWLGDKTVLRQVDERWVEITTPYLDRHNDHMQVYVRRDNGGYALTDDAYTITDLSLSGCDLDTPKRRRLLETTLRGFGVTLDGSALTVRASASNFPLRKHNLIQAMLAVNDLFSLATPIVASLFTEDVESWLLENRVRYVPRVKFTGRSGYDHLFDFAIPSSDSIPERLLKAINQPNKNAAQSLVFAWLDTRDERPPDSQAYAFLNDRDAAVPPSVVDALTSYEVHPVFWSRRAEALDALAA
jgi:hypothetical protein